MSALQGDGLSISLDTLIKYGAMAVPALAAVWALVRREIKAQTKEVVEPMEQRIQESITQLRTDLFSDIEQRLGRLDGGTATRKKGKK